MSCFAAIETDKFWIKRVQSFVTILHLLILLHNIFEIIFVYRYALIKYFYIEI